MGRIVKAFKVCNSTLRKNQTLAEVYFNGKLPHTSDGYVNIEISGHNSAAEELLRFGAWMFYFKEPGTYLITINATESGTYAADGIFGACLGQNTKPAQQTGFSLLTFPPNTMSRRVSASIILTANTEEGYNMLYYNNKDEQTVNGTIQVIKL